MNKVLTVLVVSILLCSCATYSIPVNSFKEQFPAIKDSEMEEVTVQGPVGEKVTYKTFPQDSFDCINKRGQWIRLEKTPSLEIRFTDSQNKKTIFYFDRIITTDTSVSGAYSRILGLKKTIPLSTIKKIEVQDGRKNYRYIK